MERRNYDRRHGDRRGRRSGGVILLALLAVTHAAFWGAAGMLALRAFWWPV